MAFLNPFPRKFLPVAGVALAVEGILGIHTDVAATVVLHPRALVLPAVERLVRLVPTVVLLVAHQIIADALAVGAAELTLRARALHPLAPHLVAVVPAVILPIATIIGVDAL